MSLMRIQHRWPLAVLILVAAMCSSAYAADVFFGGLGDLNGGTFSSEASAISADGSVVVGRSDSASGTEAFRWSRETGIVGLGYLSGGESTSWARGVSGDGSVIVGWACNAQYATEAFIWHQDHGMRHLRDVLDNIHGLDLAGWQLGHPIGISADGLTIVGNGTNPAGNEEAWIVRLPEPGVFLLVLLGCVWVPR